MTNANKAYGLKLVQESGGTTASLPPLEVASANTKIIGQCDPVTQLADGTVTRSDAGDGTLVIGSVTTILDENGNPVLLLEANKAGTVLISPARDSVYSIQSNSGTVVPKTVVGATADFVVTADADANTGISNVELNAADIGVGGQLRIIGKESSSEWGEENVNLLVRFNEHAGSAGTASI